MSGCDQSRSKSTSSDLARLNAHPSRCALLIILTVVSLAACQREVEVLAPAERPVRAVTVEKGEGGVPTTLTGRIEARDEAALAFRIPGRIAENDLRLGDRVNPGQVLARLESQNEQNALRTARARAAAAEAQLTEARNRFDRQETLLAGGWTTRPRFDEAQQALRTAQSQVDDAEAQLKTAHDQVSFTALKADAPGVLTAIGPRAGEVVQAGQMIVRIARQDGRDAVFEVPAQVIRSAPPDPEIIVSLADEPTAVALGRVREVAPQADPVTRTFEVKVGLTDPPEAMRLGTGVIGHMQASASATIQIPAAALTRINRQPAVWVMDPSSRTVSLHNVDVLRFDQDSVAISGGLDAGQIVITAGIQALHPGQMVRLLGAQP